MKVWVIVSKRGKPQTDVWNRIMVFNTKDMAKRDLYDFEHGCKVKRMELIEAAE